jgi:hypothetical protein
MSSPFDQFEDVQRLISCKRYEQPPPGYFNRFSAQVLARIETEEAFERSSWRSRLIARFDAKPVLVCAYGLAASGLLFFGFHLSEAFEAEVSGSPALTRAWFATSPTGSALLSQDFAGTAGDSTEPLLLSPPKQALRVEPVRLVSPVNGLSSPFGLFSSGTQQ